MKSTPVPPESLVVGFDGSSGSEHGTRLGGRPRPGGPARPLHLVRAVGRHDPKAFDPAADVDPATSLAVEQVMAKAPELRVGAQSREGSAAAVLVEASRTAATIVVGARGHGRFTSVLVGSVSQQVAAHASCPVVVVRPESAERGTEAGRVVVGLDASERSVAALSYAYAQASSRELGLTVVHSWWWEQPGGFLAGATNGGRVVGRVGPGDRPGRRAARRLARAVPRRGGAPPPGPRPPGRHARRGVAGAEMLVIGSRGRGGFTGLLLGSVSHGVLREASCPVVVVRSAAAAAEG